MHYRYRSRPKPKVQSPKPARYPRFARGARCSVQNRSGYDTFDLLRFFERACAANGVRTYKRILVVSSPIRTRGCATVARDKRGSVIVIAIAPPSKFRLSRLAQVTEHEIAHSKGREHEAMRGRLLYSDDAYYVPSWARGTRLRYRKRAPSQL